MLFFQMGWGGEFTATSMIGWIALAGIIVRNSILLVDFSIHEIQKGTPVAEAVILACKTRTRPIVITALALVAGSSVIFFDPIFQGMAISLASGVLVSTILTLVVIPLGCIKASDSLIEVAVAGMPEGDSIPVTDSDYSADSGYKPQASPSTPLLLRIWGKLFEIVMMVFYIIRGIFLLIGSLLPSRPKKDSSQTRIDTSDSDNPMDGGNGGTNGGAAPATGTGNLPPVSSDSGDSGPKASAQQPEKPVKAKAGKKKVARKKVAAKSSARGKSSTKSTAGKKAGKPAAKNAEQQSSTVNETSKTQASASQQHASRPDKQGGFGGSVRKKPGGRRGIKLKSMDDLGGPPTLN